MKKIITFIMLMLIVLSGLSNIEAKTTKKKSNRSATSSSQSFSAKSFFNRCLNAQNNLGNSLENSGFKMKYQKNTRESYDDGETYVSAKDITYEKNGIIVSYIYIPSEKSVNDVSIKFPNKSSLNYFIDTFKDCCREAGIQMYDDLDDPIEFESCNGYGQMSREGLKIFILWI